MGQLGHAGLALGTAAIAGRGTLLAQSAPRSPQNVRVGAAAFTAEPGFALSGVLEEGAPITITRSGGGLGTRASVSPLIWEDFSTGTLHPLLTRKGGTPLTITNADNLRTSRSVYNARSDYSETTVDPNTGYYNNGGYFGYGGSVVSDKWFVQYWIKLAPNWIWGKGYPDTPNGARANIKMLRYWPAITQGNASNFGWSYNGFNVGNDVVRFTETTEEQHYVFNAASVFTLNTWHCVQAETGENTGPGVKNGHRRLWVDGKLLDSADDDVTNCLSDGVAKLKQPTQFGWYDSWPWPNPNVTAPLWVYYTEIYADPSWARIEIGNASVYDDCTAREIQIPVEWKDGEVSFALRHGGHASLSGKYLYVVTPEGTRLKVGAFA